ncbi:MAG: hypothetical protein KA791_02515 [Flavobacteriales bacterium]|nr:hypothetical protein [Flavobacteriales bacterium]
MGRVAAIILFMGIGWLLAGTLFKLMHWPMSGLLRLAAHTCLGIGVALLVIAIIRNKGITGLFDPPNRNNEGGL